ncbi:MAG: hypothetical protein LLG00_11635 [Planctomycetaceae bacterium]|nr:hypothetical protein [Planctomycetaceae bacterium]
MMHDPNSVMPILRRYCEAYAAGKLSCEVVHTSGGAPKQRDTWRDPADCVGDVPPPSADEAIKYLPGIGADDDDQAARWCLEAAILSQLADYCAPSTPQRSISDLAIHIDPIQ